jgi:hypothetical protein
MIWGLTRPEYPNYGLDYAKQKLSRDYSGWLLVLNEPADHAQANLTPSEGAFLWQEVCRFWPRAKLVGPQMLIAMQGTAFYARAQGWFQQFWALLPNWARDRVAAHSYHNYLFYADEHVWQSALWMDWCSGLAGERPYWVTEWGVNADWHGDGGESAVKTIRDWYDNEPRVVRHAYYIPYVSGGNGWDDGWVQFRMYGDSGLPTAIGRGWLA